MNRSELTAIFAVSDLAVVTIQAIKESSLVIPESIDELVVTFLLSQLEDLKSFGTSTIVPTMLIERKSVKALV